MDADGNQKRYGVIYADPPWQFRTFSDKGTGRGATAHYPCLAFEDLVHINPKQWAAKNCVLLLWVPDPFLSKAFELIQAWGFTYKTVGFTWIKLNRRSHLEFFTQKDFFTGLGFWTRANAEICLLATLGSPTRKASHVKRLIVEPRREHSRKPEQAYYRIEQLVAGPYLELFARQSRIGWDSWGDQVGLFDSGSVKTRNRPSALRKKLEVSYK